jgi:hypothetical protein
MKNEPNRVLQFGLDAPFGVTLLISVLLAGWVGGEYRGLALAGVAIFVVAMLRKLKAPIGIWLPGWTVAEWSVVLGIFLTLVALLAPAMHTHCNRRRSAVPPAAAMPAATPAPAPIKQQIEK